MSSNGDQERLLKTRPTAADDRFTWIDRPHDPNGTLLPEDELAVYRATLEAVAAGADTLASDMRRREADGSIRHFKLHQRFFRDASGNALRLGASAASRFSGRVLVVEDNVVNQKVARRFLERMGCEVTVAANGEDGVRAWQENHFNLVLMDVQMPVMDGYNATRLIRSMESPPTRMPIVALNANAMVGQLEKCLDAGMDALLTKPLDVDRLRETLDRFGLAPALAAAIDVDKLLELTAGDEEFTRELIQSYLHHSAELAAQIDTCLTLGDRAQLALAVHQLAGASANLQAPPLHALCSRLEKAAPAATAESLRAMVTALNAELVRVRDALAAAVTGDAATLRVNRL